MENKLKPLFLVKPGSVSRKDIHRAEKQCGICIVECADPEASRYSEPPLTANLDEQSRAALSLMRMVLRSPNTDFKRAELVKWFVDILIGERPPLEVPTVKAVKNGTI